MTYSVHPIALAKGPRDLSQYTYAMNYGKQTTSVWYVWYIAGSTPKTLVDTGAVAPNMEQLNTVENGLAKLVDDTCRHARRFAEGFSAAGYEILNDVVLNQVLVSFGEPEKTNRIIADIQEDGTCWMGGTEWQGKTAMRISVSSWATTEQDVEISLETILRIASKYK